MIKKANRPGSLKTTGAARQPTYTTLTAARKAHQIKPYALTLTFLYPQLMQTPPSPHQLLAT